MPSTARLVLKLYVVGETKASRDIVSRLNGILDADYKGAYSLTVIDVLKHPRLAEKDRILAAPTLMKVLPPPVRKVIGDLSQREKVLLGLDLGPLR